MKKINFATYSWLLLLFFWMVNAAKNGNERDNRFPTARTASFATIDERAINATREASTHNRNQNRYAAYPTMTNMDKMVLMEKCGRNYHGDIDGVRQKIDKFGAKQVIKAWRLDWTCLHYAASYGHSNILTLLIETGLANLDLKDVHDETPLRIAIRMRKYSAVTTLVKFGASLEKAGLSKYKRLGYWGFNVAVGEEKTKAAIAKGRTLSDPKWNLKMEIRSNSTWSKTYAAEEATKIKFKYWCSARGDNAPIFWQISFTEVPVQIVKVEFEEEYPGAEFQFFASNDAQNCNADEKVLINGTREDINGIQFENDQSYPCYGLKIIQLASTKNSGPLASLKNFEFFLKGCVNNWKAGNHRDDNPKTCQRYMKEKWCTEEGALGPRWKDEWGSFTDYADANGKTARVCPQCGCGKDEMRD